MAVEDDPQSASIVAMFELPGVRKHEVVVTITDGHLIVSGERKKPSMCSCDHRASVCISSENLTASPKGDQDPAAVVIQELR